MFTHPHKNKLWSLVWLAFSLPMFLCSGFSQSKPELLAPLLKEPLQSPPVCDREIQQHLLRRVPKLGTVSTPEQWLEQSRRLRSHLLEDIVFHGWPKEWVSAPLKVEDLGLIPSGQGYRMRRLRYEIVPGFQATAILYEPSNLKGKVPAILNVNGHVGQPGKSIEYKQKRCINQAKRGILALNLEWLGCGELSHPENSHFYSAHLELAGVGSIGVFYLAMRKGLDYLYGHPNVDPELIGLTGLSGGGWQTIVLGALDDRVKVAVPVAGYSALVSRIERPSDVGDIEQNASDFLMEQDFPHLTAMRAPKPTLLIYNAEDDCCFRAPLVKPYIFDAVQPFFRLFGKEEAFRWYENIDPSDHNYQLDNRLQSYGFFSESFGLPPIQEEIPVGNEIKSYEELVVGLPKDNMTILGLARKFAAAIQYPSMPASDTEKSRWVLSERDKLKRIVRYQPLQVAQTWATGNSKSKGTETLSYVFHMPDGLSAAGVWVKAVDRPRNALLTIVLNDKGKKESSPEVSDWVNRGYQVLALDPIFIGDSAPDRPWAYTQLLAATGERALGIQSGQVIGVTEWLLNQTGAREARLVTRGVRTQVLAAVAAALRPDLFSEVVCLEAIPSLKSLFDSPISYQSAPELFCLDFYKEFDLPRLAALAGPSRVTYRMVEGSQTR